MLKRQFAELADKIDQWGSNHAPQQFKHNLTSALRIAADPESDHTIDDVLSYALHGDHNKYAEHLERQLEPIGRAVKKHLANAAANPDGVWAAWQKAYRLPKHLQEPEVEFHKEDEPFNPFAGLMNILNADQSRNADRARMPHWREECLLKSARREDKLDRGRKAKAKAALA